MNERLRVAAKRIDHVERAFRKEERPLLAQDYEMQQKTDKETFEAIQRARREAARQAHQDDLATKVRLERIMVDFVGRREVLYKKKGDEFAKKQEAAKKKIAEEKEKRRKTIMKQREEERLKREKEEQARREKEAEEARLEAERLAEEERLLAEEEAKQREAEEAKRKAEAEVAARREQREKERAEAAEVARLQEKRAEEAEARRQQARRLETPVRKPTVAAEEPQVWRKASTTTREGPPSRAESPAPSAAPTTGKYRPGAFSSSGGGWRTREAAASNGPAPRVVSGNGAAGSPTPPPAVKEETKKDDDGFQTVASRGVWKPKRGRA